MKERAGVFLLSMLYSVENLMRNLMRQAQSENKKKIKGTEMGAYMVYF